MIEKIDSISCKEDFIEYIQNLATDYTDNKDEWENKTIPDYLEQIETFIIEYNWDDGFGLPKKLLENPDCDLALALEIFYLADGYSYLIDKSRSTYLKEWKLFVEKLYNDILEGKYIQTASTFENPLTKVQRYKLKKQQIPDIFLTDL